MINPSLTVTNASFFANVIELVFGALIVLGAPVSLLIFALREQRRTSKEFRRMSRR